jgi:hypothetical protein
MFSGFWFLGLEGGGSTSGSYANLKELVLPNKKPL